MIATGLAMEMFRYVLLLAASAVTFAPPLAAQQITLGLGPEPSGNSALASTLESFLDELHASPAVEGLVEIETVPWAEPDLVRAVRDGAIDLGLVMISEIEGEREAIGPQPLAIFNQPLVFIDLEEVAFVQDSWLGDAALSELASADLLGLAFWNGGATQLVANEAINDRADLVGRKILTTLGPGWDVFHNLGASPLQVAQGDVYAALSRGVADAAEVPIEFAPTLEGTFTHLTELNYRPLVAVLIANRDRWYNLPEQARAAIGELARGAGARSMEFVVAASEEAREKLRGQEITLVSFDPSERERIREASIEKLAALPENIVDYLEDAVALIRTRSGREIQQDRDNSRRRGANEVEILFATDRNDERKLFPNAALEPRFWLGSRRNPGERYCGEATFELAANRPFASEDDEYFTLADLVLEGWGENGTACLELFADKLARAQVDSLLLFVHGFNNSFFSASKRAASLKRDLALRGPVLIWSWPSTGGSVLDYRYDKESADFTRPHFRELVLWLGQLDALRALHLLSHSMGGKIVVEALEPLPPPQSPAGWPRFDHLVFAAPDVERSIFRDQGSRARRFADHTTLYASSTDWALWISEKWNQGPRAGYGGSDGIFVERGVESIDATGVDDRWWSPTRHAYIFDRPAGIADLEALIVRNRRAGERDLSPKDKDGLTYWLLGP